MGISAVLIKESLDRAFELGERIATALEAIAARRPPVPSSNGRTVGYGELRGFVANQRPRGLNRGQAGALWDILRGYELEGWIINNVGLLQLKRDAELDVDTLKALVQSRRLRPGVIPGLGERRLDLLIRWVASL